MNFISIIDFGKHGLGALWIAYGIVMVVLTITTYKTHSKPLQQRVQDVSSVGYHYEDINPVQHTPVTTEPSFWGMVIVTVIAVVIHILITADYK